MLRSRAERLVDWVTGCTFGAIGLVLMMPYFFAAVSGIPINTDIGSMCALGFFICLYAQMEIRGLPVFGI
ncbi:hypothetical protein [Haloarcula sebkhae]|uniref:Uncharacterized protein n=2 Tax=Haloarcula sebkhae TaxID=932660 RepID=A0ACC6VNL3_9EURY|nr:hypothetical protein [Haloarcula sebkhae]GGK83085.1 hypothetical protein GCM10009067_39100 [Haloarcula sebkhae]